MNCRGYVVMNNMRG